MRSRNLKVIIILFVFLSVSCLGCMIVSGAWIYSNFRDPDNVDITVVTRSTVGVADTYSVTIRVKNTSPLTQTLVKVKFDQKYLAGVTLLESVPAYNDFEDYSTTQAREYIYDLAIAPDTIEYVSFHAEALQAGRFAGDVNVCINSSTRCVRRGIQTVIR
jgi:hypothetical protein